MKTLIRTSNQYFKTQVSRRLKEILRYPLQPLQTPRRSIHHFFMYPAIRVPTAKTNQISIPNHVHKDIIRLCVSPNNFVRVKLMDRMRYLLDPFVA